MRRSLRRGMRGLKLQAQWGYYRGSQRLRILFWGGSTYHIGTGRGDHGRAQFYSDGAEEERGRFQMAESLSIQVRVGRIGVEQSSCASDISPM